jgi:hypothetical protein
VAKPGGDRPLHRRTEQGARLTGKKAGPVSPVSWLELAAGTTATTQQQQQQTGLFCLRGHRRQGMTGRREFFCHRRQGMTGRREFFYSIKKEGPPASFQA